MVQGDVSFFIITNVVNNKNKKNIDKEIIKYVI